MVLTPHIRCSKLGMERKGGHNKDYFMPPNPDVEGCSTTNQHGHSHQSTDQPTPEEMVVEKSDPREAATDISPSSSPF